MSDCANKLGKKKRMSAFNLCPHFLLVAIHFDSLVWGFMPCPDHPKAHFPVPADEVCCKHLILPVGKAGKAEQKMLPGQSLANDWPQPEK